jgi:hypothetical protein
LEHVAGFARDDTPEHRLEKLEALLARSMNEVVPEDAALLGHRPRNISKKLTSAGRNRKANERPPPRRSNPPSRRVGVCQEYLPCGSSWPSLQATSPAAVTPGTGHLRNSW